MTELYQLRQLVAFAECGTLSEAAERLFLSQPALSRNMRKLEEEIGVPLFVRRRNKLELNENGKFAAELAVRAIAEVDSIARQVQEHDRSLRTISLGICAPAPAWRLAPLLTQLYPNMSVQTELTEETHLLERLRSGQYQLAAIRCQPQDGELVSVVCGRESLSFSLPPSHRHYAAESLQFADMDGESFLLLSDVGFWYEIAAREMPHSRFLKQTDSHSLNELLNASVLPSFGSDLASLYMELRSDRRDIPIEDAEASVTYYLVCLKESFERFEPLFRQLEKQ